MKRGLTLLEVVVSMLIINILVLVIVSFISYGLSSAKSCKEASTREKSINSSMIFLEENIVNKTGIERVYGRSMDGGLIKNQLEGRGKIELDEVFFKNQAGQVIGDENKGFGLKVFKKKKKLFYYKNDHTQNIMECLDGFEDIFIEPVPQGSSYKDAYGISFIFKLDDMRQAEFKRSIYFKNHQDRTDEDK